MGYADGVLADRPLLYVPNWDRAGTAARELSGYGRTVTHTSSPILGEPGLLAEPTASVVYNASGRYTQVASTAALALATVAIEAWIYRTSAGAGSGANGVIVQRNATSGYSLRLSDNTTNLLRFTNVNVAHYDSGFTIVLNTLYHVVAVVVGTSLTFIVNGRIVNTQTISALTTTAAVVDIGNDSGAATSAYFPGRISDVAIYNSLSQAQARRHYEVGRGLVAHMMRGRRR